MNKVEALANWHDSDVFDAREKAALEYAEAITHTDRQVTDELMAHQADRILIAATLDRLISQDDPLAKNVAASRKKSRSFFTRDSSRLR